MNRNIHSLAQQVRDDFRLLSADTRRLLQQALQRDLPDAGQRLMDSAHQKLDCSRHWLRANSRAIRHDPRAPYIAGAVGLALVAGAVWAMSRRSGCCEACECNETE